MGWLKATFLAPLFRFGEKLRFPWLFLLTVLVFGLDLMVPDVIPLLDEVLLGLGALLLGSLRKRKPVEADLPPAGNVDGDARN